MCAYKFQIKTLKRTHIKKKVHKSLKSKDISKKYKYHKKTLVNKKYTHLQKLHI